MGAPLGVGIEVDLAPSFGFGVFSSNQDGQAESTENRYSISLATARTYRTDSHKGVTGGLGDLYIGTSSVFQFAPTDALRADVPSCRVIKSTTVVWSRLQATDAQRSMFVYTELEIRHNLAALANVLQPASDAAERSKITQDLATWNRMLRSKTADASLVAPGSSEGRVLQARITQMQEAFDKAFKAKTYFEQCPPTSQRGGSRGRTRKTATTTTAVPGTGSTCHSIDIFGYYVANAVLMTVGFIASINPVGVVMHVAARSAASDLSAKANEFNGGHPRKKQIELSTYLDELATRWQSLRATLEAQLVSATSNSHDVGKSITFASGTEISVEVEMARSEELAYDLDLDVGSSLGQASDFAYKVIEAESSIAFAATFTIGAALSRGLHSANVISYTLADDDLGDVYFVRILEDPVFGVPAFILDAADSMCPCWSKSRTRCRGHPVGAAVPVSCRVLLRRDVFFSCYRWPAAACVWTWSLPSCARVRCCKWTARQTLLIWIQKLLLPFASNCPI